MKKSRDTSARAKPLPCTKFVDAKPGSVIAVELVEPTEAQRDAAEERLADLIADIWARGLLADPADDDGSEGA